MLYINNEEHYYTFSSPIPVYTKPYCSLLFTLNCFRVVINSSNSVDSSLSDSLLESLLSKSCEGAYSFSSIITLISLDSSKGDYYTILR